MRIAVVGSGIAGLGAAHALRTRFGHDVVVFEQEARLGGHSHTVDVDLDGQRYGVDTGFLVFNDRTYPRLITLFKSLNVASSASEMSFAVRNDVSGLEWSGTSIGALFADPRNAFRWRFWAMLRDVMRFNKAATTLANTNVPSDAPYGKESLGDYLRRNHYSAAFCDDYLLPMAACIWSSPKSQVLAFPIASFVHFFHNHGLLAIRNRPQWRTVTGGSRNYVAKIAALLPDIRVSTKVTQIERFDDYVLVYSHGVSERFDRIVFACHSDQALALVDKPNIAERAALSAVKYQQNTAVLHTDAAFMPKRKRAWSAWNYLVMNESAGGNQARVSLTYWINRLQPLPFATDVFVTLNPHQLPNPEKIIKTMTYAHPLLDGNAVAAQSQIRKMQGERCTYYAGAWLGYGFHEDGLASGQRVAEAIGPA